MENEKYIHFITGKKFRILDNPIALSEIKCPDCGGQDGWNCIFEPLDGPERVWGCANCKGITPRSWRWKPKPKPSGMETEAAFLDKECPQMRYNLSIPELRTH